jgi:L-asparaginase II
LGVAVKIDDGGSRAGAPAVIAALRQMDGLSASQVRELAPLAAPAVLGGGKPVGRLESVFELRARRKVSTVRTRSRA